jgi:hypothetical protein
MIGVWAELLGSLDGWELVGQQGIPQVHSIGLVVRSCRKGLVAIIAHSYITRFLSAIGHSALWISVIDNPSS